MKRMRRVALAVVVLGWIGAPGAHGNQEWG
jgi:hypothetical protein